MLTVEEATDTILSRVKPLTAERVPLLDSLGRTLAEDCSADIPLPPFDNSAVDGYAVRSADTIAASESNTIVLRSIGEICAGTVSKYRIGPGTTAKIMTGAPLPSGADAVVMIEDTRPVNLDEIAILEAARPDQYIRRAGEDAAIGALILAEGTRIRASEIGLLAMLGKSTVRTVRPPNIAVISTGDEVVDIEHGAPPPPGKIRNSNRYALAAMVIAAGARVHSQRHIADDEGDTERALKECVESGADAIVTAGGVSVGDRDFVKPVLEKLGELALWKVAMKPGKPLAFGSIGNTLFFGLPGNPVSALITFELFVRPAIAKMAGRSAVEWHHRTDTAVLMEAIAHSPGRREYVRGVTSRYEGDWQTRPTGSQGSGNLRSMAMANSLIIVPEAAGRVPTGAAVQVLWLD